MSNSRATLGLKIALIGDDNINKSVWLNGLLRGEPGFSEIEDLKAGWDLATIKGIDIGDVEAEFACVNASAEPKFKKIVDAVLRQHDGYFIFYEISNRQSFENIDLHLQRINSVKKNSDATIVIVGMHLSHDRVVAVSEYDASAKAKKLHLESYYIRRHEENFNNLAGPLRHVVHHAPAANVVVPSLDFSHCIKEIDRALTFCWDEERADTLKSFKSMLNNFSCFGTEVTRAVLADMQGECYAILEKANIILESAFPERVKMAVFGAATMVLFAAAVVCGLALLNIVTLPLLTSVLIAGCAIAGAAGAVTLGCTIFKARENLVYSSVVAEAEKVVKDFPGVKLSK